MCVGLEHRHVPTPHTCILLLMRVTSGVYRHLSTPRMIPPPKKNIYTYIIPINIPLPPPSPTHYLHILHICIIQHIVYTHNIYIIHAHKYTQMTHIIKIERVCTPNTYCIHYICIYTYIMTHYIHTPKLDSDTSKVKQSPDNRRVRDSSPPTPPFNHCPSDIVQWVAFVCVHTHTNTHTHTLTNICVYLSKESDRT